MQSQKQRMISVCCQDKPFNITIIQVYVPTTDAEEAEAEQFYEDLQDLLELSHTQKRWHFHHRELECKSRKSRDTWSNRKDWPWSTKWSRGKANRVLQENTLIITPSSNNTWDDSTHGHQQVVNTNIRLIIFFAAKDGEALYSQQKQDLELTVAQVMSSLL